ncbi:MAG: hypothetical protein NC311_12435 [Muribaculaceae bacterium]|nr:hypothetical protein [Muribaculaceae bacterium]
MRLRDLANSFLCTPDPDVISAMDGMASECLEKLYAAQEAAGCTELWTDGSYNERAKSAGIGILVRQPGQDGPDVFGKPVKAGTSADAELYAMSVGLSYLLDRFPDVKSVRLRYDCVAAAVNAANIDAYAGRGAPYTNFRSALRRCRKAGVTVLFQHVKAHGCSPENALCDLVARHYARASLSPDQQRRVAPYVKTKNRPERS